MAPLYVLFITPVFRKSLPLEMICAYQPVPRCFDHIDVLWRYLNKNGLSIFSASNHQLFRNEHLMLFGNPDRLVDVRCVLQDGSHDQRSEERPGGKVCGCSLPKQ